MKIRVPLVKLADGSWGVDLPTYFMVPGSVLPVTTVPGVTATSLGIPQDVINAHGANGVPLVTKDGICPWAPENHSSVIAATVLVEVPDDYFPDKPDKTKDATKFDLKKLKEMYPWKADKFDNTFQAKIKGNV